MTPVPAFATGWYLDDIETTTFGFFVRAVDGWDAPPVRSRASLPVPGRGGALAVAPYADESRELVIRGTLIAADPAALRACRDILLSVLTAGDAPDQASSTGGVRVRAAEPMPVGRPECELRATLVSVAYPPPEGGQLLAAAVLNVEATLACASPYKRDLTDTEVTLTSGGAACPLGTAPVAPVITITDATDPVLTLRDSTGATVATMALTGAGTFVVDCEAGTIVDGDGASILDTALADDATFVWLSAAAHGNYRLAEWPTLGITGGSAVATYRRAWL